MVKQERAARTRRSLIEAASEVFAEAGFAPASLGAISARAGVSNGALHFHFANKNMLAEAVEAQAAETVARITGAARERQGDSLQAVVDATHDLMDTLARDTVVRAGFQLAADSAARATPPVDPGPRVRWRHWVEDSLRRAGHRGALAPDCPGRTPPASSSPRPWACRSSAPRTPPGCGATTSPGCGTYCCPAWPAAATWPRW